MDHQEKTERMIKYAASLLFALSLASTAYSQNKRSLDLASVAAAENAFADMAAASGTRAAFLAFAAPDGLIFSDKPENAIENWQKRSPNNSLLSWRPSWVDVSSDATLGYTTGSWSFSRSKTESPAAWGEFFTVWRKQPDGKWKFALDLGIGHDKADVVRDNWRWPPGRSKKLKKQIGDNWRRLESDLDSSTKKDGPQKAYKQAFHDRVYLLRDGKMPIHGKSNALREITAADVRFDPLGGDSSADMAYAYGQYEIKGPGDSRETGFYCRVWKLEGSRWQIAAEVLHPVQPSKK